MKSAKFVLTLPNGEKLPVEGYLAEVVNQALANQVVELLKQRDDLLVALEEVVAISDRKHDAWDRAKAAMASVKDEAPATCTKCNTPDLCREYGRACDPYPDEEVETAVPAIVFYPSGSLGEEIESEGGHHD